MNKHLETLQTYIKQYRAGLAHLTNRQELANAVNALRANGTDHEVVPTHQAVLKIWYKRMYHVACNLYHYHSKREVMFDDVTHRSEMRVSKKSA